MMSINIRRSLLVGVTIFSLAIIPLQNSYSQIVSKNLLILHTNDTHSCVTPLNKNLADTLFAGRGGYLRRLSLINAEREKNPDLLLFDSGDFSQGSSYYTLFRGDVEVKLMNLMRYDAATIGNHEFDFGINNMVRIFKEVSFPIVCANYDFSGTALDSIVKPYVIIERDNLKIGVFGLSPILDGLVFSGNYGTIKYLDPVSSGQRVADYLRNDAKCDLVVCLSHLGWGNSDMNDQILINKTRNIDIVLGGHSHSFFRVLKYVKNIDGKDIPVDQNGKSGVYVGKLVLTFEPSHSK
jgi:5'-nucleotidase